MLSSTRTLTLVFAAAVVAAALAVLGARWSRLERPTDATPPPRLSDSPWAHSGLGKATPQRPTADADTHAVDAIKDKLMQLPSFAGTRPAGGWCVSDGLKLLPCSALHDRFEYYLSALGLIPVEQIRLVVNDEARQANGDALASQIMRVWDRYWELRNYRWQTPAVESDRTTWMPALEEQHQVRQRLLGQAWAAAFFAQDEQSFRDLYAGIEAGHPAITDPGAPVAEAASGQSAEQLYAQRAAQYGDAAAQRLAQVDEQWSDWQRRVDAARAQWGMLGQSADLSDVLRRQAMNGYLQSHFKPEEMVRIRALLQM